MKDSNFKKENCTELAEVTFIEKKKINFTTFYLDLVFEIGMSIVCSISKCQDTFSNYKDLH